MASIQKKRKHVLRNTLLILSSLPILLAVYILVTVYVISPILESIDKSKFEGLASESRALYDDIVRTSGGLENWTYDKSCEAERSGDWPTGVYYCKTLMSTEVQVKNVEQFVALHDKYYPVINQSMILSPSGDLKKAYPSDFGVRFVVSSAEREYGVKNYKSVSCKYLAALDQITGDDITYGKLIQNGIGNVVISFECTDKARADWYN